MEQPVMVLYVDDDVQSLEHRGRVLEDEYGFEMITATNADEGRTVIENHPIDCVLCDLKMPEVDGFEFFESIRGEHPNVPFILFTAHESDEIVKDAYETGMADYFPKSALNISYDLLAHRIHQVVQQSRQGDGSDTITQLDAETRGGSNDQENDKRTIHEATRSNSTSTRGDDEVRDIESRPVRRSDTGDGDVSREDALFEMVQKSVLRSESERPDIQEELAGAAEANLDQSYVDPEYFRSKSKSTGKRSPHDGLVLPTDRKNGETEATPGDVDDEFLFNFVRDALFREGDSKRDTPIDSGPIVDPETTNSSRTKLNETNDATVSGTQPLPTDQPTLDDLSRDDLLDLLEPLLTEREPNKSVDEYTTAEDTTNQSEHELMGRNVEHAHEKAAEDPDGTETGVSLTSGDSGRVETGGDSTSADHAAPESVSDPDSTGAYDVAQTPGSTTSTSETELGESRDSEMANTFWNSWVESTDYRPPEDLEVEAGDNVLVKCESQDDRKEAACTHLMGLEEYEAKNVLLVRYKQVDEPVLERIANAADRVKIVSIGYAQPVPERLVDAVEIIKINNPNDLTRLGIVVTGTIDDWRTAEAETVVCYDPLDVLLRYKNVQSVFRFLHIFLGRLGSEDAISHFHVDPSAEDPQEINTLKPLFDAVLSIDSLGSHLE